MAENPLTNGSLSSLPIFPYLEEISLALSIADTDRSSPSLRKAVDVDAFTPAELLCLFSGAGMLKYVAVNVSRHFEFPYTLEVAKKESKEKEKAKKESQKNAAKQQDGSGKKKKNTTGEGVT